MKEKKSLIKKGRVVLIQLKEGITFTWNELKNNKFRTFLSLLGVSIGIFTIVAIFTAVDALKSNVRKGFESFSNNLVQVSKWPMTPEDEDGNPILRDIEDDDEFEAVCDRFDEVQDEEDFEEL